MQTKTIQLQVLRAKSGLLLLVIISCIQACSTVRFNERERLMQPDMQFDSVELQAEIESHIFSAREGASGNFATGGGGGCGCY